MKKLLTGFFLLFNTVAWSQKYGAESSFVMFFSKTPVEDIDASTTVVNSIFNSATGDIVFSISMKTFEFKKSLMKEHFNEKYLETEKFPKSTFQGKLTGYAADKTGPQEVRAVGKLTIHGVAKDIDTPATVEFKDGKVIAASKFKVALKDHEITVPQLLWKNIAEIIDVKLEFTYKAL